MDSSAIPDHCRRFALSDGKSSDYLPACNHTHGGACDRCSLLERSISEIENALPLVAATTEELDGLKFNTEKARHGKLIFFVQSTKKRPGLM